jgi:26S proteasome regulatory subunit N9
VQKNLARDLALAGLTAEDVYGLGELLSHPITAALKADAENAWLLELVNAYNSGKIEEWNSLQSKYKAQIAQHSAVLFSMDMLVEKIAILALIELIWSRPADGRTLTFADIGKATHLVENKVELLVMRALSLGVVKGEIDQVRGVVVVSGVKPRVLSPDQIVETQKRVRLWKEHVNNTLLNVEQTELAQ